MIIRPVTDLRNHFPEVESQVKEEGAVYLTKNGYATAVLVDVDKYESLQNATPREFKKKSGESYRGYFHKYANPDLIPLEKNAWAIHAVEKYSKYMAEVKDEE